MTMLLPPPSHPQAPAFGSEFSAGMRVREYIATQLLQGLLAGEEVAATYGEAKEDAPLLARVAIVYTDALLAELAKPQES